MFLSDRNLGPNKLTLTAVTIAPTLSLSLSQSEHPNLGLEEAENNLCDTGVAEENEDEGAVDRHMLHGGHLGTSSE